MAILTLIAGAMPAAIAYVGKLIVDAVVMAMEDASIGLTQVYLRGGKPVWWWRSQRLNAELRRSILLRPVSASGSTK